MLQFYFIDEQDGSEDPVTISGVSWEVFDQVLRFVYTASYPSSQDILHSGKALIEAADKFELISLKLKVEDELVTNRVIDATNAIDYYMFADAKTCPLLKEYAAAFISSHARDVLNSESVKDLMESNELITEVLLANSDDKHCYGHPLNSKSVTELRDSLWFKRGTGCSTRRCRLHGARGRK